MNHLLSWSHLLFSFLLGLVWTSLSGLVFYFLARWLSHKHPDLLAVFAWVFAVAALYMIFWARWLLALFPLTALCVLGGFAERAAYVPRRPLVKVVPQMWLAMACNVVFSEWWLFIRGINIFLPTDSDLWFENGALLGAFASPLATSFFVYLWRNIRSRPGLDVPFEN